MRHSLWNGIGTNNKQCHVHTCIYIHVHAYTHGGGSDSRTVVKVQYPPKQTPIAPLGVLVTHVSSMYIHKLCEVVTHVCVSYRQRTSLNHMTTELPCMISFITSHHINGSQKTHLYTQYTLQQSCYCVAYQEHMIKRRRSKSV